MEDSNVLDVTEPSQFPLLKDFFKKNDVTLLLIWADYCGPCTRYKANVWSKLKSIENKKAGVASIHYDQVENSPVAGAKYRGYPSVIRVRNDGTMDEFNDEDTKESTNAMSSDEANHLESMSAIVKGEKSAAAEAAAEAAEAEEDTLEDVQNTPTPPFTASGNKLRDTVTSDEVVNNRSMNVNGTANANAAAANALPPNTDDDTEPTSRKGSRVAVGGSSVAVGGSSVAVGGGSADSLYNYLRILTDKKHTKKSTKRGKRKSRRVKKSRRNYKN